jgi:hypothetical protein
MKPQTVWQLTKCKTRQSWPLHSALLAFSWSDWEKPQNSIKMDGLWATAWTWNPLFYKAGELINQLQYSVRNGNVATRLCKIHNRTLLKTLYCHLPTQRRRKKIFRNTFLSQTSHTYFMRRVSNWSKTATQNGLLGFCTCC